jgi:hypothetical protein
VRPGIHDLFMFVNGYVSRRRRGCGDPRLTNDAPRETIDA